MSDSSQPHGLQPTRLLHPWDFPGKVLEWGAIAFSKKKNNNNNNLNKLKKRKRRKGNESWGKLHLIKEKQNKNTCRSVMSDSATPWTVAHQAPLSMEFSRQEYCSRLPFPPPGDLPDSETKSRSPALAGRFSTV